MTSGGTNLKMGETEYEKWADPHPEANECSVSRCVVKVLAAFFGFLHLVNHTENVR